MIYRLFTAAPHLRGYVRMYHLLHFKFQGTDVSPRKVYYPRPEQCLTFDPLGRVTGINKHEGITQTRGYSYLSRQQTAPYELQFSEEYLMLKVIFKPGALYRLLGIPVQEFGSNYLDAEQVIPKDVQFVNDRLLHCSSYENMIEVVEAFLTEKIKKLKNQQLPIDKALDLIGSSNKPYDIDWIASQTCLSNRQLERKYLERIGVSPVMFNRIIRFNNAVKMSSQSPSMNWQHIAWQNGYTDLSHLVKDFRYFSSYAPSRLLYEESNAVQQKLKIPSSILDDQSFKIGQ